MSSDLRKDRRLYRVSVDYTTYVFAKDEESAIDVARTDAIDGEVSSWVAAEVKPNEKIQSAKDDDWEPDCLVWLDFRSDDELTLADVWPKPEATRITQARARLLPAYSATMHGTWLISAESPNPDGPIQVNPPIAVFTGTYADAVAAALKLDAFFTFGYGGRISPVKALS